VVIHESEEIIKEHEAAESLRRKRQCDNSAKYRASGARGLQNLGELVVSNHNSMLAGTFVRAYKGHAVSRGQEGKYAAAIDRHFSCLDRQRAFWKLFGEIDDDDDFKTDLEDEMAAWNADDIVEYADALDEAYLSVLKKSRAKRVAAKRSRKPNWAEQAAQKKRDAVNQEIRRLEEDDETSE
jgi:hypothetical protein